MTDKFLFIAHRINTVAELQKVPHEYGVEIDVRDQGNELILQHDPYSSGERLEDWLLHYHHAFIILNIKSEGVEWRLMEIMKQHNITEYMFLDSSIPMIHKLIKEGEHRIAIRVSELEPIQLAEKFIGKVDWLWIDCLTDYPQGLLEHQDTLGYFKLCLVSHSLHGRSLVIDPSILQQVHAVCEKYYNDKCWLNARSGTYNNNEDSSAV